VQCEKLVVCCSLITGLIHQIGTRKTENMHRKWFVLVCLLTWSTRQVNSDKEMCNSEMKGVIGESLILVTHWPHRVKRCHIVFTEENRGDQCCYHLKGKGEDCAKYTKRNGSRCLKKGEYNMTCDGRGTETCNLTIESFSENSAGQYRILTADDEHKHCYDVKVTGQGPIGPVTVTVTVLVVFTLLAILFAIFIRQRHIKIWMDGGTLTFDWRSCCVQLESRALESREEGMEMRDPASQ